MSRLPDLQPEPPPGVSDRFRFGFRDVQQISRSGKLIVKQVPLTARDVLHPQEGDHIWHDDPHENDRTYLKSGFKARLADAPGSLVLSDCGVDFNIPGVAHFRPDIAVLADVYRHASWTIFNIAEEGARPLLVIEITSPSTRDNDLVKKVDDYQRGGVPWYLIVDVTTTDEDERRIEFILYHKVGRGYRRIPLNDQGRVYLEPVRLWIGQTRRPDRHDATGLLRPGDRPGTRGLQ